MSTTTSAAKAPESETSPMSGKLEAEVELQAPPAKFFNVLRKSAHQIPSHTPSKIKSINLHEGDWESHGTIKIWNYTFEGKEEMLKERVEFDDGKKTMKVHGLEGDVMKLYKVYNGIFEFVSEDNGDGVAKLTIEYEKLDPKFPAPTKYLDFVISFLKDIDAGLAKAA
ncbi:MLP-like protein 328 [Linum grandiflorum]